MQEEVVARAPLACVPGAIAEEERPAHFALARRLFGGAVGAREEVPGGYAYRFAPGSLEEVARFVAGERRCCPFLDFEIVAPAPHEAVWLRLTGPEGTRALLDHALLTEGGTDAGDRRGG